MRYLKEEQLIVDNRADTPELVYDTPLRDTLPSLQQSFAQINQSYEEDKQAAFGRLVENRFTIKPASNGLPVEASVLVDDESEWSDQALIVFAPFSDVAPQSTAETITEFLQDDSPGFMDINRAKPHSWNQTTKSAAIHDLLKAEGQAMPVVTIFSPISTAAFSAKEIKDFRSGNFSPAGQIAKLAFEHTQDFLHGPRSETQLDRLHFYGASLGAANAVGSAAALLVRSNLRSNHQVASVTAQELILGPTNRLDLMKRFTVGATIGDESTELFSKHAPKIPETAMRKDLVQHGNELAMFTRMARGMLKLSYLKGLTRPQHTVEDVHVLGITGVPVTIATAKNSGLTEHTEQYLSGLVRNKHLVHVRGVAGEKASHLINEHVAASATIALMGISKSIAKR